MPDNAELVTFGGTDQNAVTFRGRQVAPSTFQQSYSGFRTGPGADRTALTDLTKVKFSDFSGGLDPTPGIKSWLRDLNKFAMNQGWQTRLAGMMVLPFEITNQTALTSDESVAAAVAAGWRAHAVATSLGGSESRIYIGLGHKVLRNVGSGSSALEVCYTTTDVITSVAVLNVNGTPRLCVATNGTTDDVFYVADPTGTWSGNTTTLIALTSGDYITGMQYFPTLGSGANILVGTISEDPGVHWVDTETAAAWTPRPVVTENSRNSDGSLGATTTSAVTVSVGSTDSTSGSIIEPGNDASPPDGGDTRMANPGNLTASDDSYCSNVSSIGENAVVLFDTVFGSGCDFSAVPRAARILGILVEVEAAEGATTDNAIWASVRLIINGSQAGVNHADGAELPTTEAFKSFGGSSDTWGLNELTGADIQNMGAAVQILASVANNSTLSAGSIDLDSIRVTLTYREQGDMVSFPLGGWGVTPNPAFPERMAIVVPATANDTSGITEPRVLWFLDFKWDAAQERPVLNYSRPNTGLNYVHHAAPFQGGWAITGNNSAGPGVSLKHVDGSGNLRDFGFPAHNGDEEFRINTVYGQGSWLVLDCVALDNGDRQWWFYNNGRYFPDTLLQSLTDGLDIAAQPIPFSTTAFDLQNDRIYSLFPNGSDLGVARQFLPPDLGADIRIVYPNEAKAQATTSSDEDTKLWLRVVELDIGPEEASKSVLVMEYLGRRISAATGASYGSVTVEIVTDADTAFATPDITHAFTAAFEAYNVPSAGVNYNSLIVRIGGAHDADSAESPDGVPILITTVQDWPPERVYTFLVEELVSPDNIFDFMDQLETLVRDPAQPLDFSVYPNQPAKFDKYLIPTEGLLLPPRSVQPAPTHFVGADGEPVYIGLQFHTIPGTGAA